MRKYMKPLIIGVALVLALTVGITSLTLASGNSNSEDTSAITPKALTSEVSSSDEDVVSAASTDNETVENTPSEVFLNKVADILGIDVGELTDAMKQARQEMWYDAIQQRLDQAVADGLISEGDAADILAWYQSRPEALNNLQPLGRGGMGFGRFGHLGRLGWNIGCFAG